MRMYWTAALEAQRQLEAENGVPHKSNPKTTNLSQRMQQQEQSRGAPTARKRSMAPRLLRPDVARSKNSFWMSGYRFASSTPYRSHAPTVFSRSCTM